MRKILLGVIIGLILSISFQVFAADALKVAKNKADVKYYGSDVSLDAYNINGSTYLKLRDVANLFETPISYKNNTIMIGDITRQSSVYYMTDLSAYPSMDDVVELPPYEIDVGGCVDFRFITKNISFDDMRKKIDTKLKVDGFAVTTKDQYTELTNSKHEFEQGKNENTYIKYKDNNKEVTPYAIQLIDGGLDQNNTPIIIAKMME